jgi:hypothetical protein
MSLLHASVVALVLVQTVLGFAHSGTYYLWANPRPRGKMKFALCTFVFYHHVAPYLQWLITHILPLVIRMNAPEEGSAWMEQPVQLMEFTAMFLDLCRYHLWYISWHGAKHTQ